MRSPTSVLNSGWPCPRSPPQMFPGTLKAIAHAREQQREQVEGREDGDTEEEQQTARSGMADVEARQVCLVARDLKIHAALLEPEDGVVQGLR